MKSSGVSVMKSNPLTFGYSVDILLKSLAEIPKLNSTENKSKRDKL